MKRAHFLTSLCLTGLLSAGVASVGCNRSEEPETNASGAVQEAGSDRAAQSAPAGMPEHGQDTTVTGCLTANIDGRSYALTPSDANRTAAGQSMQMPGRETVTYELVGDAADFQRHVNTVVTARGQSDASAAREAEVEREDESEQRPAAGVKDTPTVETKEEVEVNVRRLHVASVVGTGDACPSLGPGGGRATEAPRAPGAATTPGAPKGGTTPRP